MSQILALGLAAFDENFVGALSDLLMSGCGVGVSHVFGHNYCFVG